MELQESEGSVRFYSSGHETHCQRAFGARRFNFVKATQMTATGGIGIAWHGARLAAGARLRAGAWRLIAAILASVLVLAALPARADDDLPARVGRLASVQGDVFHAPDEHVGDWAEIGLNYPIAEGDNLWVQGDGRAEVDYGGGQFRLAGDTNLHVSRLDDRQLALFIAAGRVIVRVRVLEADDSVRIDTPASQIALMRPGLYRIDVASDSPHTTVVVREGEAQVATPAGAEQVFPGQTASLTGIANEAADIRNGGGVDGFDAWSAARDRVYEQPRQNAYVSRQMIGQADLDAYGMWQSYPDYGAVWFPADVATDWAPYRFGHWTWLSGWGYTWVDSAAWGYAPFHYGRWAYIGGRWGWCPGMYVARPLWAPALVAWYGGSGWSHAAAHGGPLFGWVPLGWREPFVPWWDRCTSRCKERYNRPYAVNVAERRDALPTHYANWRVPGGITAVPADALASGKPVAMNRVPVGADVPVAPPLLARAPAIKPAPVRPGAVRPGNGVPVPASSLYEARVTVPPASAAGRAPTMPIAPAARGLSVSPPAGGTGRPATRIDDGRNVLPPAAVRAVPLPPAGSAATNRSTPVPPAATLERQTGAPVAPVAPGMAPRSTSVAPVAPVPAQRSFRTAPLPPVVSPPAAMRPPVAPVPSIAPAAAPRVAPPVAPVAPVAPVPRVVPPTAPLPQAVPASVPAQRGAPIRIAPPNPQQN